MIIIVLAVLLVAGFLGLVMATQWHDTPKPAQTLELTKPQDTILAEEVITVTRRRTVKATRT